MHDADEDEPANDEYDPVVQLTHDAFMEAEEAEDHFPASQGKQALLVEAPSILENVPA